MKLGMKNENENYEKEAKGAKNEMKQYGSAQMRKHESCL